jgi:hypothetical protein
MIKLKRKAFPLLIDLFLLLLLSFFLGSQLWKVLGRNFKAPPRKGESLFILRKDQVVIEKDSTSKASFYQGFNESAFLEGAEKAFEQIVLALHQGDQKTLAQRLTPHLLESFSHKAPTPKGTIKKVCLLSSTILSRSLKEDQASITVQFTSQQPLGASIQTIEEVWTFTRCITSENPNWLLDQVEESSKTS